jgi:hypothetical protein
MAKPEKLWFPVKYKNRPTTLVSTRREVNVRVCAHLCKIREACVKRLPKSC